MHHHDLMDYSHPPTKNLYLEGEFLSRKQAHKFFRTCREYESVEVLAVDK
jgi:hypothetical protein